MQQQKEKLIIILQYSIIFFLFNVIRTFSFKAENSRNWPDKYVHCSNNGNRGKQVSQFNQDSWRETGNDAKNHLLCFFFSEFPSQWKRWNFIHDVVNADADVYWIGDAPNNALLFYFASSSQLLIHLSLTSTLDSLRILQLYEETSSMQSCSASGTY